MLFWGEVFCFGVRKVKGVVWTPTFFSMSDKATEEYLSPDDVKEFRAAIFDAGMRLGTLLKPEYPKAELVSDAQYNFSKVVEGYGLDGKWVASWASAAHDEFVATSEV